MVLVLCKVDSPDKTLDPRSVDGGPVSITPLYGGFLCSFFVVADVVLISSLRMLLGNPRSRLPEWVDEVFDGVPPFSW